MGKKIIILNGSAELEERLISLAIRNELGGLTVSSPRYRNYDLFHGLPNDAIRALFEAAAQNQMELYKLGDYTEAFLAILKRRYAPNFHSMFALSLKTDREIAEYGAYCGVREEYLNRIKDGYASGLFRRTLTDFGTAFLNLEGGEPTGISVAGIGSSGRTHLIWTDSEKQRIVNSVLAQELSYLGSRWQTPILLITNQISFTRDDPLLDAINKAKLNGRYGMCCADVISYNTCFEGSWKDNPFSSHFPTLVVLNSGAEDPNDLDQVLEKYGKYHHHEVAKGIAEAPGLFRLPGLGAPHHAFAPVQERPRVTAEDMRKYAVAAMGDDGDRVNLYKSITGGEL